MTTQVWSGGSTSLQHEALRASVAESLGGEFLDEAQVRGAYDAAANWLRSVDRSNSMHVATESPVARIIGGSCDDGRLVLQHAMAIAAELSPRVPAARRAVVWLGCRPHTSRAIERDLVGALDGSATIVASDLSAGGPLLRGLLRPVEPSAPRRVRVELDGHARRLARLPFLPAVRLAAGHLSLTSDVGRVAGCQILARNAESGNPVTVLMPVLGGHLLYSSAHWLQHEPVDMTQAGQRRLFSVPGYAQIGRDFPFVSLGEFHAAVAMLSVLATGLVTAWSGLGSGPVNDTAPWQRGAGEEASGNGTNT